jgi:hypothetical protein
LSNLYTVSNCKSEEANTCTSQVSDLLASVNKLVPGASGSAADTDTATAGNADDKSSVDIVCVEDILRYVDTTEITVNGRTCWPLVFDKIIKRSNSLSEVLVGEKQTLIELIKIVNSTNVGNNSKLSELYDPLSTRTLVDPFGRWTDPKSGPNPRLRKRIRPDLMSSPQMAFDMLIVHARSLVRDIPFREFATNTTVASIVNSLNAVLAKYPTIRTFNPDGTTLSSSNFLRNNFLGEDKGPFWNQFQLFPTHNGTSNTPLARVYYQEKDDTKARTLDGYREQQKGVTGFKKLLDVSGGVRPIETPRDVIGYVHSDVLPVGFQEAGDILLRSGLRRQSLFEQNNLPEETASFFGENGCGFVKTLLPHVIRNGLVAAWNHKYSFLRIRPERLAYYWHIMKMDSDTMSSQQMLDLKMGLRRILAVHESIMGDAVDIMDMVNGADNGGYLLHNLYPEGSPTHPSFVGGHSVASGVQATMLKMMFQMYSNPYAPEDHTLVKWITAMKDAYDADFGLDENGMSVFEQTVSAMQNNTGVRLYPDNVRGSILEGNTGKYTNVPGSSEDVTVLGEVHKLASQYTFSRDWGGVHYTTDGYYGMYVGQSVAVDYMQNILSGLPSNGDGFDARLVFPSFDGRKVRIGTDTIEYFCQTSMQYVSVDEPEGLYPAFIRERLINEPVQSTEATKY